MAKCIYPRCDSCRLENGIKDIQAPKKERKKKDRTAYQKNYYQKNKEKVKERYNAQTQYVKWVDLKKTITRIKKDLGTINYEILMREIEKLERFKHS